MVSDMKIFRNVFIAILVLGTFSTLFLCSEAKNRQKRQIEDVLKPLIGFAINKITGLWHRGEVKFLGHNCRTRRVPYIRRLQLWYKGRFSCPSLAEFRGEGRSRNPKHALRDAAEDFVKKILEKNIVSAEQVKEWTNQQGKE
ncbi:UNVERIFIED_CONTAM: hypothetical protein RMT77_013772 [Armadillidium vulgare]